MSDHDQPAGGYSRRFLERREAPAEDASPAPFGAWYAQRQRRRTGQPAEAPAPEARTGDDACEPPEPRPDASEGADAAAAEPPRGAAFDAASGAASDAASGDAAPAGDEPSERGTLQPRGWPAAIEPRVERRLRRNARELRRIEGNLAAAGGEARVLGFTSCLDGEGKTTAALNAAYGLAARSAERVLLIDANPGNPSLHRIFSCAPAPGLREVLAGGTAVEDALHPASPAGLDVLAAGGGWYGLGSGLPVSRLRALLDLLRGAYGYVLLDAASLFSSSDAARIAPVLDGYALVVACERTKWELAQSADEKIRATGSRVVGVVLNRRRYYLPRRVYEWLSRGAYR